MSSENNKELLANIEKAIGYKFKNKSLLKTAITHRSFLPESKNEKFDNERLEFLGDAVLELIISDLLYRKFADKFREGDLTKMRAYLVSEARLFKLSDKLGLGDALFLGKGEEKSGGRMRPSILADAFEALTGAIYLDAGFEGAYKFVKKMFKDLFDVVEAKGLFFDYKTRLQEFTQRVFHDLPHYKVLEATGPDHERMFTVALIFQDKEVSKGTGRTKKEAEQQAAKIALEKFKEQMEKDGPRE